MVYFKKSLCIILAVVVLFFGVSNSYFSPHKMDNVNASALATVAVISVDTIIKLICAVGIAGLSYAVISEWSDMDLEAVVEDIHNWLRTTKDEAVIAYIDGSSALKEWVASDEWVVVEGTGGNPQPSPDPNEKDKRGIKKALGLPDTLDVVSLGNLLALGATSVYSFFLQDGTFNNIGEAYIQDKVSNLSTTPVGTDPLSDAFLARYGELLDTTPYYDGTFKRTSDGDFYINAVTYQNMGSDTRITKMYGTLNGSNDSVVSVLTYSDATQYTWTPYQVLNGKLYSFTLSYESKITKKEDGSLSYMNGKMSSGMSMCTTISSNIPIFNTYEDAREYAQTLDDSKCINKQRRHNYLDPEEEFGWASTSGLTPNDLFQATQGLLANIDGKYVSLSSIMTAINAVKAQLEDNNPNNIPAADPASAPVTYPTTQDYVDIVKAVVSDPAVFPEKDPGSGTEPDIDPNPGTDTKPDIDTDPDTDASPNYTGLLNIIIGLLEKILQAIRDILDFLVAWFVIDIDAIADHLELALQNIPNIDGVLPILAIIDDFKLSINDHYEYPKLTIQTPDILRPYIATDIIVLVDFEDYATYFIWIRTFLSFSICFGFALWIIRDIKVAFTLN